MNIISNRIELDDVLRADTKVDDGIGIYHNTWRGFLHPAEHVVISFFGAFGQTQLLHTSGHLAESRCLKMLLSRIDDLVDEGTLLNRE